MLITQSFLFEILLLYNVKLMDVSFEFHLLYYICKSCFILAQFLKQSYTLFFQAWTLFDNVHNFI